MTIKKAFSFIFLVIAISITASNSLRAQGGWEDTDPGGEVPIPGVVYFLIAALAIGAKKLYNAKNRF